jgi:hypothetical protein
MKKGRLPDQLNSLESLIALGPKTLLIKLIDCCKLHPTQCFQKRAFFQMFQLELNDWLQQTAQRQQIGREEQVVVGKQQESGVGSAERENVQRRGERGELGGERRGEGGVEGAGDSLEFRLKGF